MLYPDGHDIPAGGVRLRAATAEEVYRVYYAATHCPNGHRRDRSPRQNGTSVICGVCVDSARRAPAEWTWGAPAAGT